MPGMLHAAWLAVEQQQVWQGRGYAQRQKGAAARQVHVQAGAGSMAWQIW